ncbi:KH domain-containing protein [Bdellovibrio bacteriovorus]|uniref:KH domain-containing protein n=1 Tax=Bdellovibrio bacteriovorus TaxID=959 RepID=UPI0002F68580|nr:KH domain-containing protein [Bdellovibrio bacteriovorus]
MGAESVKVIKVVRSSSTSRVDSGAAPLADNIAEIREKAREFLLSALQMLAPEAQGIGVDVVIGEKTTQYVVSCPKEAIGRVIGQRGATIMSLRQVLGAIMGAAGARAVIEIPYYPADK